MNEVLNVIVCGVSGQGVNSLAKIIAHAAASYGCECKLLPWGEYKAGSSSAVMIKYGDEVLSSQIGKGEADVILALEKLECARWITYLKIGGKIISSTKKIPLANESDNEKYPDDVFDNLAMLGVDITAIDTDMICKLSEDAQGIGIALLGVAYEALGFTKDVVRDSIKKVLNEKEAELAIKAFDISLAMGNYGEASND